MAVDGQHIYWASLTFGTVGEANLDGTGVNQSLIAGNPFAVAVDGQRIYWPSAGSNTIGEANLDGSSVNQSFITGANDPVAVAVDGRHLFWANETGGTIGEASLDGTGVNQSFVTGAAQPTGVAVSVPVLGISPSAPSAFASTPQGTLSAPQTLTLSNAGQQALSLSGLSFAGADPADFLIGSDTCLGFIDPGSSCQLTIYFAPEAEGSRSASLQIQSNDYAKSPASVPLSGTGGQLPQGPAGQSGAPARTERLGRRGPAGPAGPAGRPG
jgi:hypothetical protein